MSHVETPPLPSFLIIGAQKSATRWLRRHLGEHPEIFTADRELRFFNGGLYEEGLDAYRKLFEGWGGEPIVGEATPSYMMWRESPAHISARIRVSAGSPALRAPAKPGGPHLLGIPPPHTRRTHTVRD